MSFITMTLCHKYGNDIYLATMNTSIKYEWNCGMRSESKKNIKIHGSANSNKIFFYAGIRQCRQSLRQK